ncbi:unnamed protein product [Closterium sp. Naga37s-1]|nr:unnamed protein product [Closterium sp. Naga37s-1]
MLRQLSDLESRDGWRIRVATRYGVESGLDGKQIRDLWQPSDRTVIVVADVASPNILSFSIGEAVRSKLPYQFFTELQSSSKAVLSKLPCQFFTCPSGTTTCSYPLHLLPSISLSSIFSTSLHIPSAAPLPPLSSFRSPVNLLFTCIA